MSIKILMPALSPTMTEGNLSKWLVKIGDKVKAGDVIAEVETDKATMEVEAVDEGIITHLINIKDNISIPVNNVIALINGSKEETISNKNEKTAIVEKARTNQDSTNYNIQKEKKQNFSVDKKNFTSPYSRSFAKVNNLNLEDIQGSGPNGRIIKRDVIKLKNREEADAILREYRIIEPSNIRKIIAKKTTQTKQQVPHFYLTIVSSTDKLVAFKNKINEINENNISYNDILIKALAIALKKNIKANVSWINDKIYQYSTIDISFAVALKEGLITPIIKDADKKGIFEISSEVKNLITKANENNLLPEEFIGGSISISNLGMYGISEFSAIINPPQASILAIGSIQKVPIIKNNKIIIGNQVKSTLSADHRVLDGAVAAKLLKDFNDIVENPFDIWLESNDTGII